MAAGEYVSVSSQADMENAAILRETEELAYDPVSETEKLAQIYAARGVNVLLARKVASRLVSRDALGAHSRDELGISELSRARPVQAAMASAASFAIGATAPLTLTAVSPRNILLPAVGAGSLVFLALLRLVGVWAGGAGVLRPTLRVVFRGALAMAITTGIGALFGSVV